jgi:ribose transport system ATP-binding protein
MEAENVYQAQAAGISTIYQELNLIPYLSVAENIFLGDIPRKGIGLDWKGVYRRAQKILEDLHLDLNPRTPVKKLGVAQQQMIEVAKAVSRKVEVLIMDEPTSSLTDKEIEELFNIIARLKAKGVGIVYISHRMEELLQIGDRVTILRDGKYIETLNITPDMNIDGLIRSMIGRDLTEQYPKEKLNIGNELLRVEHINTNKLKDCSFHVRGGEILGFAGIMGAGRTELMRALTGADPRRSGDIYLRGAKIRINSFRDAVRNKIGLLTEDRKGQGLVLKFDVRKNITLAGLSKICAGGVLSLKRENFAAQKMVDALRVKTPYLSQRAVNLSGGNQQKVVLAKWLFAGCDVIIFDEPTRGIDVGAKVEIYKLMIQEARRGAAVIMVSSELPEIIGMSDRVIVMQNGRISGELSGEEITQDTIIKLATGG